LGIARSAHAAGRDEIRVALVGCGGRGTGAAAQILNARPNVKLVAMADAFETPLRVSLNSLRQLPIGDRVLVTPATQFTGLDAYRQAIAADVDVVLLCTPPGFRPLHFEAAVAAGRHVFMEKPVATDAPGVRRVLAANERAKEQGLLVAVGHHLRHEGKHQEVVRRIRDGAIGELQYLRAYFNSSGVWVRPRRPDQTEMQYQVSNWYYFTWLSGDHIVEQHVHDLDVGNWIAADHPQEAQAAGGRQVRVGPQYGEIFDHHTVEFTYASGVKMFSFCRHIKNCWNSFSQHAHGHRGEAHIEGHGTATLQVHGQQPLRFPRQADGHQVEQDDFVAALMEGRAYNEADWGASSTMTAILGRMASYTGQVVTWREACESSTDLMPRQLDWDAEPPAHPGPDGLYACAMPGLTPL
jgi:predicted dehydrogenase